MTDSLGFISTPRNPYTVHVKFLMRQCLEDAKRRGIQAKEIALALGVGFSALSNWASDRHYSVIPIDYMVRFCCLLEDNRLVEYAAKQLGFRLVEDPENEEAVTRMTA
jgi:transcriptional regulator with XRE-family HTH domain